MSTAREVFMDCRESSHTSVRVNTTSNARRRRRPDSRLAKLLFLGVVAVLAATPQIDAAEGELPVLEGRESIVSLELRVSPYCPDPPAALPATELRLELGEFEGTADPMTLEILESKEIRIELTVRRDGFEGEGGASIHVEPLRRVPDSAGRGTTEIAVTGTSVDDLQPSVIYFARALVLVGDGWVPTETTRFMTPVCAVDGLEREEVAP